MKIMHFIDAKGWFVFLLTVCLAADIYAENQDDVIDQLFEQEIDIYNLGTSDEVRGSRSLLGGNQGHHNQHHGDHQHEHGDQHQDHGDHHQRHEHDHHGNQHLDHVEDHQHLEHAHGDHQQAHEEHEHDHIDEDLIDEVRVGKLFSQLGKTEPRGTHQETTLALQGQTQQLPTANLALAAGQQQQLPTANLGLDAGQQQQPLRAISGIAAAAVGQQQKAVNSPHQPTADLGLAVGQQQRTGKKLQTIGLRNNNNVNVDENESYQFEYKVADETEQVYQKHAQNSNNQVVTGEYSWVDPLGTLHIIRYRADETGYNILENIEKRNFIDIVPREKQRKKTVRKERKFSRPRLADPRRPTIFKSVNDRHNGITYDASTVTKPVTVASTAAPVVVAKQLSRPQTSASRQQLISPAATIKLSLPASTVKLSTTASPQQPIRTVSFQQLNNTPAPIQSTNTISLQQLIRTPLPKQLPETPCPLQLNETPSLQQQDNTVSLQQLTGTATPEQFTRKPSPQQFTGIASPQQFTRTVSPQQPPAFVRLPQRPSTRPEAVLLSSIPSQPALPKQPVRLNRIRSGPVRRFRIRPSQRAQLLASIPVKKQRNQFNTQTTAQISDQVSTDFESTPVKLQTASVQVPIFSLSGKQIQQQRRPALIQPNSISFTQNNNGPAVVTNSVPFNRPVALSSPNIVAPAPAADPLIVQRPTLPTSLIVPGPPRVVSSPVPIIISNQLPVESPLQSANSDPLVQNNQSSRIVSTSSGQIGSFAPVSLLPALPLPPLPTLNTIQVSSQNKEEPFQAHPDPDLTKRIFGGSGKVRFNAPSHKYEYRA